MRPTSLIVVILLAVFADAVKVFRAGNAKVPVTGTEAKAKDFGAEVDGKFQPGHGGGLSTNIDPALLPGKPTKNVYSIDSAQVIAGGFGFLADGSDVGGKAGKGHRSIVIKKPFTPTALLHALNALPWKREPDAPKPTKTPAPRAIAHDEEAEPTEPAAPTPIAPIACAVPSVRPDNAPGMSSAVLGSAPNPTGSAARAPPVKVTTQSVKPAPKVIPRLDRSAGAGKFSAKFTSPLGGSPIPQVRQLTPHLKKYHRNLRRS